MAGATPAQAHTAYENADPLTIGAESQDPKTANVAISELADDPGGSREGQGRRRPPRRRQPRPARRPRRPEEKAAQQAEVKEVANSPWTKLGDALSLRSTSRPRRAFPPRA